LRLSPREPANNQSGARNDSMGNRLQLSLGIVKISWECRAGGWWHTPSKAGAARLRCCCVRVNVMAYPFAGGSGFGWRAV